MASTPLDVRLATQGLLQISWSDGGTLHYPVPHLRARCPCAHCREAPEGTGGPEAFPGLRIRSIQPVGRYAFQIGFSDGHALGIYPFDLLRDIGYAEGTAPVVAEPQPFDV